MSLNPPLPGKRNRRGAPRFKVERVAEVMVKGYVIEFPTRDVSEGGVCLDSLGITHLRPGDTCSIVMGVDDEVTCEVIEITKTILRLRFLDGDAREALRHFGASHPDEAADRPNLGAL